jgi:cytochrome c oxidase subunit 2
MHSQDVIHGFWVPEWRIKKDNVPGITTTAVITPDRVGTFQLICTQLCGFGHATMRAVVRVEPPRQFQRWVSGLKEKVPKPLQESVIQDTQSNPQPLEEEGGA